MGEITSFNLSEFIEKYKIDIYFETGTGQCTSLEYASKFNFKKLYSVDIDEDLYQSAKNKFIDNEKIVLLNDLSTNAIIQTVPTISKDYNVLFFLDAHFPGADFHKITYEESIIKYKEIAFPLIEELKLITDLRDMSKDVIIIDDFVLYDQKNENYESIKSGNIWKYGWLQDELKIKTDGKIVMDMFSNTHDIIKDYRHQGYLILTPKNYEI